MSTLFQKLEICQTKCAHFLLLVGARPGVVASCAQARPERFSVKHDVDCGTGLGWHNEGLGEQLEILVRVA